MVAAASDAKDYYDDAFYTSGSWKKKCQHHLLADYSFGIAQPISVDEKDLRNYAYYVSALH